MIFDVYLVGKELVDHDFRMATSLGKSLSIMIFDVYLVGKELVNHDFWMATLLGKSLSIMIFGWLPRWERACQS